MVNPDLVGTLPTELQGNIHIIIHLRPVVNPDLVGTLPTELQGNIHIIIHLRPVVNPDLVGTLPTELQGNMLNIIIHLRFQWLIPTLSGLYRLSYRGIFTSSFTFVQWLIPTLSGLYRLSYRGIFTSSFTFVQWLIPTLSGLYRLSYRGIYFSGNLIAHINGVNYFLEKFVFPAYFYVDNLLCLDNTINKLITVDQKK